LEGRGLSLIEVLSRNLLPRTEENHKETSIRTTGVQAEITKEHLSNSSPESYRYTNILGARDDDTKEFIFG
jgi:hypothetical protein